MTRLLTVDDVADRLGVTKDWVWAQARAGRIPHVQLGRYRRFREEALETWLDELEGAERRGPTRRGARFSQRGLESGVEHNALVIRHGDLALLDAPAIICRSWHPSEDPNLEGEELELEIALPRARQADVRVLLEVRPRGRVRTHRPNAAACESRAERSGPA